MASVPYCFEFMSKRSAPFESSRPNRGRRVVTDSVKIERANVINALQPVVQMLQGMLGSNVEIVLHDLTAPSKSVIAIANGHVTGRSIGSSILGGPKNDQSLSAVMSEMTVRGDAAHAIFKDYATENASGQCLRSSSVIFRDTQGEPFAALCLNADMSVFESAHAWLERILNKKGVSPEPPVTGAPEMDVLMSEIIEDAVHKLGKRVSMMTKEERIYAVQVMMRRGLFIVKGGVPRAAAALGVTRHTIYSYLEELKMRGVSSDPPHLD